MDGPVCGGARLALYGATLVGRRQVVRHWILIPAFEGSIPSAPASQPLLCRGFPSPFKSLVYCTAQILVDKRSEAGNAGI
jgi:hypothetical protein